MDLSNVSQPGDVNLGHTGIGNYGIASERHNVDSEHLGSHLVRFRILKKLPCLVAGQDASLAK